MALVRPLQNASLGCSLETSSKETTSWHTVLSSCLSRSFCHSTIFGIEQFLSKRIYITSTQKCSCSIFLKKKNNDTCTLASRWCGIHVIPPPACCRYAIYIIASFMSLLPGLSGLWRRFVVFLSVTTSQFSTHEGIPVYRSEKKPSSTDSWTSLTSSTILLHKNLPLSSTLINKPNIR